MTTKQLIVTILAAGEGKRMRSPNLPKVLNLVDGVPMLIRILRSVVLIKPKKIVVVTSPANHDKIKRAIHKYFQEQEQEQPYNIVFVLQPSPLGTGHAVKYCLPEYIDKGGELSKVLILNGDMPLINKELLQRFITESDTSLLSLIVATMENPHGYGRIIHGVNDDSLEIVEEKDCSVEQRLIKQVNTGVYLVDADLLHEVIPKIKNDNVQQEYYLTDIVKLVNKEAESKKYNRITPYLLDQKKKIRNSKMNTHKE